MCTFANYEAYANPSKISGNPLPGIIPNCQNHQMGQKLSTVTIYFCMNFDQKLDFLHRASFLNYKYVGKYQEKQARKPRSYASSKLCPLAHSLTGVKCRATSVAKKHQVGCNRQQTCVALHCCCIVLWRAFMEDC